MRHLLEVPEVQALIRRGEPLLLAGDEALLRQLPPGRWIAGTIPYFMTEDGGVRDRGRVYVDRPSPRLEALGVRRYGAHDVARIYLDLPPGAVGLMIAPSTSAVHRAFALGAPTFPGFASRPLFGWIAGVPLEDLGRARARVFDGTTGQALADEAVVMHASVQAGYAAELAILNIFEPGEGPAISFPETGFTAVAATVDGRRVNFHDYVREAALDTRLPLVADYCGAPVNVSFQALDARRKEVQLFAPVFAGVTYRHARSVGDYVRAFELALPRGLADEVALSCNCVLNYVHCALEGRSTAGIVGPMTFGEIAYQLLNQTLVYLTLSRAR